MIRTRAASLVLLLIIVGNSVLLGQDVAKETTVHFEALPEGVASFGAATLNDDIYVYSGHTGKTHSYSKNHMLMGFFRASLHGDRKWERLALPIPAQGVALVAAKNRIYRIGGMQARNEPGASHDLYSLKEVAAYDPGNNLWESLPDLPEPRSSHRAAIVDDKLYVFGGWTIQGGEDGEWLEAGCVLDLSGEVKQWRSIDQPKPLRALEVVGFKGRVALIGGLTPDDEISDKVYFFDPRTEKWSDGPAIPGMPANGNGIAACVVDDQLYIAGMDGKVNRLNSEQNGWQECGKLPSPRIHHRLVPGVSSQMVVIGGASRAGHIAGVDSITLEKGN
jgi:N-acetylneuraminic acid mutarotase